MIVARWIKGEADSTAAAIGSKATLGSVIAFNPFVSPLCASAASAFADWISEFLSASVICDCVVHETAMAGAAAVSDNPAAKIHVRIRMGDLSKRSSHPHRVRTGAGAPKPDKHRERNRTTASLYIQSGQVGATVRPCA